MAESAEFLLNLRNGFIPELKDADQTRRRSVISENRQKAIGNSLLYPEFIRLASKQGQPVFSSIWGLEVGRESRLRHLFLSKELEEKGIFFRVNILNGDNASGFCYWYITNPAYLEYLPGVSLPSDSLLAEIYVCRCLNESGFTVSATDKSSGKFAFIAEKDGCHLSVSIGSDLMLKVADGAADHQVPLQDFLSFLQNNLFI